MFSTSDTIVAIATPAGRGGIGVVRVSGGEAHAIVRRLAGRDQPFEARRATLVVVGGDPAGARGAVDQAIVTWFPAPASYTGDDVVEISAHGSPVVLRAIVDAAVAAGARIAEPGEFTLRAFVNGKLDLMQAEAVADLIESVTPLQARTAFDQLNGTLTREIGAIDAALFDLIARLEASVDFPDEGYHFIEPGSVAARIDAILGQVEALLATARRGRMVRDGLQVAIAGAPNVGKSSLFNALVGAPRAIVTDVPGTTRDLVSETIDLDGLELVLVDTAGARATTDAVESEGVGRAIRAAETADLVLLVVDRSQPPPIDDDIFGRANIRRQLIVANKADLPAAWHRDDVEVVSATTGVGLDTLRRRIAAALDFELAPDRPAITNARHAALLEQARTALARARGAVAAGAPLPEEFVLADLQAGLAAIEEITGKRTSDEVLAHIFARFCVGK